MSADSARGGNISATINLHANHYFSFHANAWFVGIRSRDLPSRLISRLRYGVPNPSHGPSMRSGVVLVTEIKTREISTRRITIYYPAKGDNNVVAVLSLSCVIIAPE